jgi:hypothetical protein
MKTNKNIDLAITIGIIIILIYALKKIIGLIQNPLGIPEQSGGTSEQTADPNQSNLTKPKSQYASWCDTIEEIIWGSGMIPSPSTWYMSEEERNQIVYIMKQMNNIDDVQEMVKTYGKRGRGLILQDYPNLVQTLNQYLEPSDRQAINYDYELKFIPFAF